MEYLRLNPREIRKFEVFRAPSRQAAGCFQPFHYPKMDLLSSTEWHILYKNRQKSQILRSRALNILSIHGKDPPEAFRPKNPLFYYDILKILPLGIQ